MIKGNKRLVGTVDNSLAKVGWKSVLFLNFISGVDTKESDLAGHGYGNGKRGYFGTEFEKNKRSQNLISRTEFFPSNSFVCSRLELVIHYPIYSSQVFVSFSHKTIRYRFSMADWLGRSISMNNSIMQYKVKFN